MRNLICKPTSVRYNILNDSLFNDRFFSAPLRALAEERPSPFVEVEGVYKAAFSLPGIKKEAVTITVVDDELKITAQSEEGAPFKVDFNASYLLPEEAKLDELTAALEDGVLSLAIPKLEPEVVPERVIEIQ